ncbi:hypothetical protein H072_6406 [Dactylellina haptotyla CBS 200.50]|uniref:Ketoreductase (KR) domain-containing protein n=1 Tax=Dactylellina haptotyla (strain CBS 200.50) TaxID=1284197 RepID=S8AAF5_DACHA|nr:hypothetical protein H072_6406 [Dactylellina haptotyla CBS 200.50]
MVAIETIKSSNAALKGKLPAGLVALFVGATSGIGEQTLRTFYQNAPSPRVYFIGRSQSSADRIISSLKPLNPDGHLEFIQADLTLLKNVDEATKQFTEKEKELNLLVMSQGFLTMGGRDGNTPTYTYPNYSSPTPPPVYLNRINEYTTTETTEGIDTKLALNWFSRARLIQSLLPTLSATASKSPFGARVVSVLAAGHEGPINFDDFELKKTFSLRNAAAHAGSANSAMVNYLAKQYPSVGFVHSYPGVVDTPMLEASKFPGIVKLTARVLMPVFRGFMISPEDSGARHCWMATDEKFKTGGWNMDNDNEESAAAKKSYEKGYCDEAVGEKVWKLTSEVFEKVEKEGKV